VLTDRIATLSGHQPMPAETASLTAMPAVVPSLR
jgi:hypothetical protein